MKRFATLTGCVLLSALCVCSPASAGWWSLGWRYRRGVVVEDYKPTGLPGSDIAVVTMPTGGLCLRDGGDIRVATAAGREVPCRVLMVGPGDRAVVAFALRGGLKRYYVYFGNPKPPKKRPLEIRRGVLLEMWRFPGGRTRTLKQVENVFARTKKLIGAGFRDRIFQGHNPFGPQPAVAALYTAWLKCPKDGKYIFSCTSMNASFLLVDDKLVVANGGRHGPHRDIRARGSVELKAGLHKLTFYHASQWGNPIVVAAWRPPGTWRILPIPPGAFAPVFTAKPGAMGQQGMAGGIDFIPAHLGETFVMNHYNQRYAFEALTSGKAGRNIRWRWDFGDGQVSEKPKVEHVYLESGTYTVTLTAKTYLGELKRVNRVVVSRPWDEVIQNRLDRLADQAKIVSGYDFRTLSPTAALCGMRLLSRARMPEAMLQAGSEFCRRKKASGKAVKSVIVMYAEALLSRDSPKEAIAALTGGAKMTDDPDIAADLLVRAGRVQLDMLGQDKAAYEIFQAVLKRHASTKVALTLQQARIGLGDVWRVRGDYDKALKAYKSAAPAPASGKADRKPVTRGGFIRYVEDYLRRGEYADAAERLQQWERAFPADKLEGFMSLLRVRLLMAQSKHAQAAREAETLVRVNPSSNHAAELLMQAARCHGKLKRPKQARSVLERIVKEYRESPLAAEAKKLLAGG